MRGAIIPLPHTSSWCGALLSIRYGEDEGFKDCVQNVGRGVSRETSAGTTKKEMGRQH